MGVNKFGPQSFGVKKNVQLGNNYFAEVQCVYGVADVLPVGTILALNTDTGKYAPLTLTTTDGLNIPAGIVTDPKTFATIATELPVTIVTGGRINMDDVVLPSGATAVQTAEIHDALRKLGMELEFSHNS